MIKPPVIPDKLNNYIGWTIGDQFNGLQKTVTLLFLKITVQETGEPFVVFRIVKPDSILTQDWVQARLNIFVDDNNVITGFKAG